MPLYSLDIEKLQSGEYWTNRYILNASTLAAARDASPAILQAERNITLNAVTFTRYRVSDRDPTTDSFIIVPSNTVGLVAPGSDELPLFNVLRVDFGVFGGRPSRKYLRGVLQESDIQFNSITGSRLTFFNTNYSAAMLAVVAFVDVDGQPFESAVAYTQVSMRQLRRGSRRRTQPIIP